MHYSTICLFLVAVVAAGQARYLPPRDIDRYVQEYENYPQPQKNEHSRRVKEDEEEQKDYYDPPHYTYEYKVDDYKNGDFKRHRESRADGAVEGYYSLVEADGSLRTVHYTADDKNGFNAVVTRTEPGHKQE